jgi:hypothetical protein
MFDLIYAFRQVSIVTSLSPVLGVRLVPRRRLPPVVIAPATVLTDVLLAFTPGRPVYTTETLMLLVASN